MKTNISEDLPARKFSPAASGGGESGSSGAAGPGGDIEKKARQLVYDAKYEVRKMMGKDTRMDPAAVTRAVLQRIDKSSSSQPVKMRARKIVMGDTQKRDVKEFASQNVAKALFDIFVNHSTNVIDEEKLKKDLEEAIETQGEKKYKVRVTDKKTGNSYIRWATRPKITELRGNPNIESVEMLDLYGSPEPYSGEKKKGSQTASVTAGKGLADKDYDGDGKVESGAKEYRGSVHNAIQRKKGGAADGKDTSSVKEEFIGEGDSDGEDRKQIKPMKGKNKCKVYDGKGGGNMMMGQGLMNHQELEGGVIAETGYSRFVNMVQEKMNLATADMGDVVKDFQQSDSPQFKGKTKKERQKMALAAKLEAERKVGMREEMECGPDDDQKKKEKEIDPRQMKTVRDRLRTKLGLMGLRMSYEPEGEVIDEDMPKRAKGPRPSGTRTFTGMGYYGRTKGEKEDPKSMKRIFPEPKEDKPSYDDETPRRRYRDEDPSLDARRRNPKLR
jgi:hypothetical protein